MNIQFLFAYFDIYQFKTFKLLLFIVIALYNNIGLLYAQATKPNVIIMFMDDMGWGDLGCYGHPAEETPHLDQMANEGMRFTDWYSGSNICSPSRASLLTGRLPVRNGFYSTTQMARNSYSPQEVLGGIAESEVLLSEVLHESGYRTKIVGKWHLGHHERHLPLQHGFEEWFGAPNCHYKYDDVVIPNIPVYKNDKMTGRYYDDYKFDHETGEGNLTQLYVQEALDFIDAASNSASPFFLYWTPDATHTPLYASKSYRGRSQRGLYGDAVMEIDAGVGKIMGRLRKHKLDRNTFVFFSSDNGAATYAHEDGGSNGPFLCGKQTTFEGGYRQPALAWWPGQIKAGQVSHQVGNMMDLLPTIAGMAGAKLPADIKLDGIDLRHTLLNGTTEDRPTFYYRGDTLFHVRVGFYKAFYYSWGSPLFAQKFHYKYCPGQHVENITTEDMRDYTKHPVLFHLGKDPGEKYPIDSSTDEYHNAMIAINKAKDLHEKELIRAKPEFNMCDLAAQNWAPAGCEEIGRCMKIPPSAPYVCDWPY